MGLSPRARGNPIYKQMESKKVVYPKVILGKYQVRHGERFRMQYVEFETNPGYPSMAQENLRQEKERRDSMEGV